VGAVIQDFTHDRRGAVLTASEEVGSSTYDSSFGYGPDGSLTSVTYPSGRELVLTPDFAGRPTSISSTPPGGGSAVTVLADADYLPSGPAERLELGPAAGRVTETLGYDWQYRRTGQTDVGPGATSLIDLSYGYIASVPGFRKLGSWSWHRHILILKPGTEAGCHSCRRIRTTPRNYMHGDTKCGRGMRQQANLDQ